MSEERPPTPTKRTGWLQRLLQPEPTLTRQSASRAFELIGSYYDLLMSHVPYQRWVDYIEQLLDRFDAHPRTVLDLACGTGRVGGEIARRGFKAVGVDLSEGMVRVAVEKKRLPAAVQDARALGFRRGAFDLVVSLYDSLNYILDPTGLLNTFRGIRHCLADNGLLIFDLNTIRALALNLFTQNNLRSDEPLLYSWKSAWDPDSRICTVHMWFKWRGPGEQREFVEVHRQRGYTDEEVRELLQQAGLKPYAVYDAYTFNSLGRLSTRAFYIAHKE